MKIIWLCCSAGVDNELENLRIIDLCFRLGFLSGKNGTPCLNTICISSTVPNHYHLHALIPSIPEVLVSPNADAHGLVARLELEHDSTCESLEKSLVTAGNMYSMVSKQQFMEWAKLTTPQLLLTLSTFMHNFSSTASG